MKYLWLFTFVIHACVMATDEDLIKKFDRYAEEERQAWEVPGMAIGIVKGDKVIFAKGYGQRGLDDKRPVDTQTFFQIGSLSKAFASALVAKAVDKGWLKWNDKVIQHDPLFRLSDPWVTTEFEIQDLLAQRSGLYPYAGDTQAFLGFSQKEILRNLQFLRSASSFRSEYAYQNVFFLVAGHVLELKSRKPYATLLQEELFNPLEMKNTNASLEGYLQADNRAQWLMRLDDGSTIHLKDDFPQNNWNYILGPAGDINSNVEDMTRWLLLQANGGEFKGKQLISSENMKRMTRPMIYASELDGRALYYALGWVRMENSPHPIILHDGSTLGVYNVAAFIPEEKVGIVILTNVRNTKLALGLALQFFDMYFDKPNQNWSQQLLAKKEAPKQEEVKDPSPAMPLARYAGTYTNPIYGEAIVKEEKGQLVLMMKRGPQQWTLTHWDRDIFTFTWPLIEDEVSRVNFIQGDNGETAFMVIDTFAKEGSGYFTKEL